MKQLQKIFQWFDPVPPDYRPFKAAFESSIDAYIWSLFPIVGWLVAFSMAFFSLLDLLLYPGFFWQLSAWRLIGLVLIPAAFAFLSRGRPMASPYPFFYLMIGVITGTVYAMMALTDDWTGLYWAFLLLSMVTLYG